MVVIFAIFVVVAFAFFDFAAQRRALGKIALGARFVAFSTALFRALVEATIFAVNAFGRFDTAAA